MAWCIIHPLIPFILWRIYLVYKESLSEEIVNKQAYFKFKYALDKAAWTAAELCDSEPAPFKTPFRSFRWFFEAFPI